MSNIHLLETGWIFCFFTSILTKIISFLNVAVITHFPAILVTLLVASMFWAVTISQTFCNGYYMFGLTLCCRVRLLVKSKVSYLGAVRTGTRHIISLCLNVPVSRMRLLYGWSEALRTVLRDNARSIYINTCYQILFGN